MSYQFNQEKFNNFVLENKVVGFFEEPIKLKSGRMSNWYVNWRDVAGDVFLLDKLTEHIIGFIDDLGLDPDCFYGVPEGATKLGVLLQYKLAKKSSKYGVGSHVLPMGRGKPKDHGDIKDRFFVGKPKGKTVVVEDVTTTGGSLLSTIDDLKKAGVSVISTLCLTNRMELRDDGKSVKEAIESKGVKYHALSKASDLLPQAYNKLNPGTKIATEIEKEFKKYGVKKIKLL